MRKKIIIGFLVFFVLLVGVLIAIPFVFKDKINVLVKEQINNELKVSVDYSDYDLTILSSFPDFRFLLKDLVVIGQGPFEGDTLAIMKEMNFDLDAKKMYQDRELQIHSIYVDKLNLKVLVLEDSTSSLEIFKEKPATETTKIDTATESLINMNFESLIVEHSNVIYKNDLTKQAVVIKDLNINTSADYKNEKATIEGNSQIAELIYLLDNANKEVKISDLDFNLDGTFIENKLDFDSKATATELEYISKESKQIFSASHVEVDLIGDYLNSFSNISTKTALNSVSFSQEDTKYLNNSKLKLDGEIKADLNNMLFTFIKNHLKVNDLIVDYAGSVALPTNDINIDLNFATNKSTFKELLSIIPSKYLSDYKDVNIKGGFDLKGFVKGVYNDNSFPKFDVDMGIVDGFFKNNSLPTPVENINLKANLKSLTSDMSKMDLNIPKATFTIENEPIDLSLKMLDLKNDAYVDLKAKGKLDLEKIPSFYEIKDLKKIDGNVDMDITFKGKLSDVDKKNFNNVDFQGDLKIVDMIYDTKSTEMPIKVKTMNLDFTPQYANMTNLDMTYGKSDIKANGKLENVINYVLSDGIIKGNLNIKSNKVNLTELMGKEEAKAKTTSTSEKSTAIRVPKRIDFTTHADIKELLYDDILMKNVNGKLNMKNEQLNMKSISAIMLGGKAKINGTYNTVKEGNPVINFKYDINNFDIKQTFKYVNTVEKIAPIAKFLDGKFSSAFSFNSLLEDDFMPDMSMISGLGDVKIPYASFLNFPLFKSVSNAIKIPMLDLDKAAIKNAWTVFKIENGRVEVEPFDYEYQDIKMNIFGSNGLDQSINYTMKVTVPSNKFGGAAGLANDWLSKQKIPLLNLNVPKDITFHLNLSGFLKNPKVKILKVTADGIDKGIVEQVVDNVKDKAKEAAEKLKKEAEERARKEAEKLKKELEKQAQAAADKLKKDMEDRLRKEAEDRIKKEAEDKLQDILKDNLPNFGF